MVDTATVSQMAHLGAGIAIGFGAIGAGIGLGIATKGLLDAVAVGNIFAAPGVQVCYDAIKAANSGKGVLVCIGNYSGDLMIAKSHIHEGSCTHQAHDENLTAERDG